MTKEQRLAELQSVIRFLQEQVSALAQELDGDLIERCKKLKRAGLFVEAIKVYRNERGTCLKEAKDMVDSL